MIERLLLNVATVISILVAIAMLQLAGCGTAVAQTWTPEAEAAYQAALVSWGVDAPPNCGAVDRQLVPIDDLEGHEGLATQATSYQEVCTFDLAAELPPCMLREAAEHEVGHLLGFGHLPAPSIMASGESTYYYCLVGDLAAGQRRLAAKTRRCRQSESPRCWAAARSRRVLLRAERAALPPAPTFPPLG